MTAMSMTQQDWQRSIRDLLGHLTVRQTQRCPYCDTSLSADALSCTRCGESLKGLLDLSLHESYFREACEQFAEGDRAQALGTLALCLALRPNYGAALSLKSGLLALEGCLEEAEAVMTSAPLGVSHDTDTAALAAAIAHGAQESRVRGSVPEMRRPARRQTRARPVTARNTASVQSAQCWRAVVASACTGAGLAALTYWLSRYLARGGGDGQPAR